MSLYIILLMCCALCGCDYFDDITYSLNIGHSINVFANYGDLSQVTQVVSAAYQIDESDEPIEPFREKNMRVFNNASSIEIYDNLGMVMNILLCETFDDLLNIYFNNFTIEGTTVPWKAFMGDWVLDEIMRTFGIEYDANIENCCYVLVKLSKVHKTVKLDVDLSNVEVTDILKEAIDALNVSDSCEVRKFMTSYGTHYIDSYTTGDFVYQVFKYKRNGYYLLKRYVRIHRRRLQEDNLRFYFSTYFLRQVGDIRTASGNKTIEDWAQKNLSEFQYMFSRPSILRLRNNANLAYKLRALLEDSALLSLDLKTLKPIFKDEQKAKIYAEIIDNDLKLWEINA